MSDETREFPNGLTTLEALIDLNRRLTAVEKSREPSKPVRQKYRHRKAGTVCDDPTHLHEEPFWDPLPEPAGDPQNTKMWSAEEVNQNWKAVYDLLESTKAERDKLKKTVEELAIDCDNLKSALRKLRVQTGQDFWSWQGDGEDHLESLVCPVRIMPRDLEAIIAERDKLAAENAKLKANVETNQDRVMRLAARVQELEGDLHSLSEFCQSRHPIGRVKHIGLRESPEAARQIIAELESRPDYKPVIESCWKLWGESTGTSAAIDAAMKLANEEPTDA